MTEILEEAGPNGSASSAYLVLEKRSNYGIIWYNEVKQAKGDTDHECNSYSNFIN